MRQPKKLHKTARLGVRFSAQQRAALDRALRAESRRRGEAIEISTLVRELVMDGVQRILTTEDAA